MPSRSEFTTSDGCRLTYVRRPGVEGAPRVVLIHSLALDASLWDGVVAHLDSDADILAYDCRGHGRSGRAGGSLPAPSWDDPFTSELFARDLAELLDAVGWPSALVAGCSMGGNVAQAFAARHPERAVALALVDTTACYGPEGAREWRERADAARAGGLAPFVGVQVPRWVSDAFLSAHGDVVRALVDVFLANDPSCYAAACALLARADGREWLPSFRMPVTVIVGEDDRATPVAAAQALHGAIAGARLVVLPRARHLTPVECPDRIADEIRALAARAARA